MFPVSDTDGHEVKILAHEPVNSCVQNPNFTKSMVLSSAVFLENIGKAQDTLYVPSAVKGVLTANNKELGCSISAFSL